MVCIKKQPNRLFFGIIKIMEYKFPDGFLWGSATSAHQVEGGNFNDWTEWEHANSERLAAEAARRHAKTHMRIPDYILERYPNPLQPENYISGKACDHYNRYEQDFDIAKSLGQNAHRFSIEWSRIEPEEGKFSEAEIEHYRKVILALRQRGLEPFVTLWHWTNPTWFAKRSGWLNKDSPKYFERYVNKITLSLEDVKVNFWITLNEPEVYVGASYFSGQWPPQKSSLISGIKVYQNLIKAHQLVYKKIHQISGNSLVGTAKNNSFYEPFSDYLLDRLVVRLNHYLRNEWFLNKIKNYQDFIGLNYYFHDRVKFSLTLKSPGGIFVRNKNKNESINNLGWEIYPEGIYRVLKDLKKYDKPIYITENGLADANDEKRAKFIKEHLRWVHKVIQEGVDVRGYLYWSLLDNFEWDKGFWPRFGLVEVDYKTTERRIRSSAYEYAKICKNNALEI